MPRKSSNARARKSNSNGRARKANSSPNALTLLKADHQKVSEMFDRFERSRKESVKDDLAQQICDELTVHTSVEEEVFYPAVREEIGDDDLMDEAVVEHNSAKLLIAEIKRGRRGNDKFDAKVTVLGEYVKHHIKEEQNEMFKKARKSGVDLKELGARIEERKQELEGHL